MSEETFNLAFVAAGARLKLADGSVADVIDNPGDGVWVFCRFLSHSDPAKLAEGSEHPVFVHDVVDVLAES